MKSSEETIINEKNGENLNQDITQKGKKQKIKEEKTRKHIEPTKILATIIISILVAIILFSACGTFIYCLVNN